MGGDPEHTGPPFFAGDDAGHVGADRPPALPRHVYVHVPVCRSKCTYCDFFSLPVDSVPMPPAAIADALLNQTRAWAERGLAVGGVDTLYIGGGTPTMLGDALPGLVSALAIWCEVEQDAEVTVEANPDSLTPALVETLAMAGVTRVSLGVQSFSDAELAVLGRPHDATEARRAAGWVVDSGLALSVDVMCGLPGQDESSWRASVAAAVACGPSHLSVYPLQVEDDTPLAAAIAAGELTAPDEDEVAAMLAAASEMLAAEGFGRYEVANYARPGCESRHNTAYWTGMPYLGIGPGAHGMLDARTARAAGVIVPAGVARVRYGVTPDLREGLGVMPEVEVEYLSAQEAAREDAMLGLRRTRGIDEALAARAGVVQALKSLAAEGLVSRVSGRWAATDRGWLLGNEVFGRVWAGG